MRIDIRFAPGGAQAQALAKELVALRPDVIAHSAQIAAALQRETRAIPIVFVNVNDPIGAGFVASVARPGGNLTGLLHYEEGISGKWLASLKEIAPRLARAALVANPKNPVYDYFVRSANAAAASLAIELVRSPVENAADASANSTPSRACRTVGYSCRRISRPLSTAISSSHSRLATACLRCTRSASLSRLGSHVLWHRPVRHVRADRLLCRPHTARRQTRRPTGAGADQVRDWSSTSKPRKRSASTCRHRCSCAPTRS